MKKISFLGFLVVLVVLLTGVFGWLVINKVIPINPDQPYFSETKKVLFGVDWSMGRFEPVYLWRYTKNKGTYLKVAYRDGSRRVRLADVFAGGRWNGVDSPIYKVNGGIGADSYPYRFGQRLMVDYLETGKMMPGTEIVKGVICEDMPAICGLAAYVENLGGLSNVTINKEVPRGVIVPAINIFVMTEKK